MKGEKALQRDQLKGFMVFSGSVAPFESYTFQNKWPACHEKISPKLPLVSVLTALSVVDCFESEILNHFFGTAD